MRDRPSLLYILTDQQRSDTLACYGNDFIQVPHLNKLAEQSFVFRRAYCAQPLCTPSRATLMTGVWPHIHGSLRNNVPLAAPLQTLAEMMPPGYRPAYYGKWHLGDELVPQRGFEEWLSIEDGHYRKYFSSRRQLELRSDYHRFLAGNGFQTDSRARDGARVFSRWFAAALEDRFTKASFLGHRAARFIEEKAGSDPFAMVVSFLEPHPPLVGPLDGLHDTQALPLGDAFLEPPSDEMSKRSRRFARRFKRHFKQYPLGTESDWRRLRANYYGLITLVDQAVGRILQALEGSGRADDTMVVFTSDHGDMLGDHGILGKGVMYEEATRVPWLMRVPWLDRNPALIDEPVSQIDLLPTLLDLIGAETPSRLQGRSLAGMLRGEEPFGNGHVVVEWHSEGIRDGDIRTVISRDEWKLNLYTRDRWELFDLSCDPFERTNLFDREGHGARVRQMYDALREWQASVEDPVRFPEPGRSPGLVHSLRSSVGRA